MGTEKDKAQNTIQEFYARWTKEDMTTLNSDLQVLLKREDFRRFLVSIIKRMRVFGSIVGETHDEIMRSIGWREAGLDIYQSASHANSKLVAKAIEERNAVDEARRVALKQAILSAGGDDATAD